jgi:hypothetical protein
MSLDPHSCRASLGPYIVVAACLVLGVLLTVIGDKTPSMVISVLLACGIAALLYGILGGVTGADFNLGPLKVGGSAAVLLGGTWLINYYLQPQLEDRSRDLAIEKLNFDPQKDVEPAPTGWYAIDKRTGQPTTVIFQYERYDDGRDEFVSWKFENSPPSEALIRFVLEPKKDGGREYIVKGRSADEPLGVIAKDDIADTVGIIDSNPIAIWGPRSLYMPKDDVELSADQRSAWGNIACSGTALPLKIRVTKLGLVEEHEGEGHTHFEVTPCNSMEDGNVRTSSLKSDQGEKFEIEFDGKKKRTFIIAVVSANHETNPPWSRFVVIELD